MAKMNTLTRMIRTTLLVIAALVLAVSSIAVEAKVFDETTKSALPTEGLVPDIVEFNALKDLFTSTGGTTWTTKTNWPTTWPASATAAQMATWYGVTVTGGDITGIALATNNMTGTLPASLNNLTRVTSLNLRNNKLVGAIPDLSAITVLASLYLHDNDLTGAIPTWLGDLSNLVNLYLSNNELTGTIPSSLGELSKLVRLYLDGNNLTGGIPGDLGKLSLLQVFDLHDNQLTGSIPPELGELTELTTFTVATNALSGTLPASLGNLTKLQYFYAPDNQLTGSVPASYSRWTSLLSFQVYTNKLSGAIPAAVVGAWTNVLNIQIYNNLFSGDFPATVSNCTNITYIRAANNKFTSIPSSLLSLTKLNYLNFQSNELTAIPNLATHPNKVNLAAYFQYNYIDLNSWEPIFTNAGGHGIKTLGYTPQNKFKVTKVYQPQAGTLTLTPVGKGSSGAVNWEKKVGTNWSSVGTADPYQVANVTTAAAGTYRWTLTNTTVPSLTLQSDNIEVEITDAAPATNSTIALYNGLITAARWRTDKVYQSTDPDFEGQYTYAYDDKYQIKNANWANPNTPAQTTNTYGLAGMSYDPNGNIQTLRRYDKNGVRSNDFGYDYAYEEAGELKKNNNQLMRVTGYVNAYQYNALGQMIGEDKVTGDDQYVEYDVSGKVTKVFSESTKKKLKVEYLYDDRGFRLAKKNYAYENNQNVLKLTTWYIRDGSGNVLSIYEEDYVQHTLNLKEVPVYGSGKIGTHYPLQDGSTNYELTDHLGNVRALVRDNVSIYTATMEDNGQGELSNPRVEEMQYFTNLFETSVQDVRMNHTPAMPGRVAAPDRTSYLYWVDGMQGMQAADKSIGPATTLKVSQGDKVDIETWVRFERKANYAKNFSLVTLASYLGNSFAYAGGFEGYTLSQTTQNLSAALTSGLYPDDGGDDTRPFAYLNYMVYDNNMVFKNAGWQRVTDNAGFDSGEENQQNAHEHLSFNTLNIAEDGYIYVWVSNQSEATKVWFDDLTVKHAGAVVAQATDYGVWGDVIRESGSPGLLDQPTEIKKSLIAQYLFNANAQDYSGTGLNGVVSGATLTTDNQGNANAAYSFDGVDDKITLTGSEDDLAFVQNTGVFTISAFIKLNSLTARSSIVGSAKTSLNKGFTFMYETVGSSYGDRQLNFTSMYGTSGSYNMIKGTYQFNDTGWHHVAIVGDGKNFTLYVDGIQDGASKKITYFSSGPSTFATLIGGTNDANNNITLPMNGSIDDVHIFNRALTASEIQNLMNRKDVEAAPAIAQYQGKYRFGYQGQFSEKDLETGWNHFELREFDPVIGRWLIVDPYRQHWSPYLAMGNNAVNLVDLDGGADGVVKEENGRYFWWDAERLIWVPTGDEMVFEFEWWPDERGWFAKGLESLMAPIVQFGRGKSFEIGVKGEIGSKIINGQFAGGTYSTEPDNMGFFGLAGLQADPKAGPKFGNNDKADNPFEFQLQTKAYIAFKTSVPKDGVFFLNQEVHIKTQLNFGFWNITHYSNGDLELGWGIALKTPWGKTKDGEPTKTYKEKYDGKAGLNNKVAGRGWRGGLITLGN
ncbi:MAG: LamG-like jellyroll fold domain-containing protein [Bacteroidota bacterium]